MMIEWYVEGRSMNRNEKREIDQHTIADWPIEIHNLSEIPEEYQREILRSLNNNILDYVLIFAPACRMVKESFDYLFAYGKDEVVYFKKEFGTIKHTVIKRINIFKIITRKELLDAEIIIESKDGMIVFPYVPSSYYLYDPFLNWLMGLKVDFLPHIAEQKNPRPKKLYYDSLTMYNYSLAAYRLGNGFQKYSYKVEKRRKKWVPWKSSLEEWLDIIMDRGIFHLHSLEYLTECIYEFSNI